MTVSTTPKDPHAYSPETWGLALGIAGGLFPPDTEMQQALEVFAIAATGTRRLTGLDAEDPPTARVVNNFTLSFCSASLAARAARTALQILKSASANTQIQNKTDAIPLYPLLPLNLSIQLPCEEFEKLQIVMNLASIYKKVPVPLDELRDRAHDVRIDEWGREDVFVNQGTSRLPCYKGSYFEVDGPKNGNYTITRREHQKRGHEFFIIAKEMLQF